MIKYASVTSLLSTFLFIAVTFTASKFQSFNQNIYFGYPFIFFTSDAEKIIDADKSFSAFNLCADILIFVMASMLVVKLLSLGVRPARQLSKQ